MSRRALMIMGALALMGGAVYATGLYYSEVISASQANTAKSFSDNRSGGSAAAFDATTVMFSNAGPNTVYIDLRDTTATTADRVLKAGERFTEEWDPRTGGDGWSGYGAICAAGETATVTVWADR